MSGGLQLSCGGAEPEGTFGRFVSSSKVKEERSFLGTRKAVMKNRLHGRVKVESLRNHPVGDVETLQRLLSAGANAEADPHHKDFYEVEDAGRVFYVYISPVNGQVRLAAIWQSNSHPETVRAARACCAA